MLTLKDVTLGYATRPILQLDNLHVKENESCLITGPSGSGKTTLLYAVAGVHKPISGSIIIDGTNITALSESACDRFRGQHIGLIFQTLHLVRALNVLDNLLLAPYAANLPQKKARAFELLERLNVADKAERLPEELSQGQAQRVAIARALMISPKLLLADEPTSSLDDRSAEDVITLIQEVAREAGTALLVSTHDARVKSRFFNVLTLEGK